LHTILFLKPGATLSVRKSPKRKRIGNPDVVGRIAVVCVAVDDSPTALGGDHCAGYASTGPSMCLP
jgi:hypothetical protein